jgi:multidrug efflux pump subunit AcrA (membrane-fusion protein)
VLGSLLLAGIAAAGVYFWRDGRKPPVPPKSAVVEAVPDPGAEVSFTGVIAARQVVAVPASVEGLLESVEVETGAEVFEGQLLARIQNTGLESSRDAARLEKDNVETRVNNLESSLIAARLESSRAAAESMRLRGEYEKAEKNAVRQQMLLREGATPRLVHERAQRDWELVRKEYDSASETSRQAQKRVDELSRDLDAAKRALEEKSSELEAATADLAGGEVVSPTDGILIAARAQAGDNVDMTVVDLFQIAIEPGQLKIQIDPRPPVRKRLTNGLPALVQVLEISGDAINGEVIIDEDGQVWVEFDTGDPSIKPGLNAMVKIKLP